MIKTKWFSFLKLNIFEFGDQKITQFVIFECKYLFSIIVFYFHKSNGSQDRYHTHAFNALSIKLFGTYIEYFIDKNIYKSQKRTNILVFFPKSRFHKIGQSNGCCTILFSGPWNNQWLEKKDNIITKYEWGRQLKNT